MLSRRVFLLSAFALPGLPLLQRSALGKELLSSKILVLAENNCSDTSIFSTCLPSTLIEADPSAVLLELDSNFQSGEYEFVFGLSRDSNFVLIEQYAQSSSYRLAFQGRHKYGSKGMSHNLHGNQEVIRNLSSQIVDESEDWAKTISKVPVLSNYQDSQMVSEELHTSHIYPSLSPGHLVSWLFKREQA